MRYGGIRILECRKFVISEDKCVHTCSTSTLFTADMKYDEHTNFGKRIVFEFSACLLFKLLKSGFWERFFVWYSEFICMFYHILVAMMYTFMDMFYGIFLNIKIHTYITYNTLLTSKGKCIV